MTQRNPMNDRYQDKDGQKTGKTRKSAASAKPKTKAASSVYISNSEAKPTTRLAQATRKAKNEKASSKKTREQSPETRAKYYDPGTPEYKKWRRVYWGTLIAALAFTALSFVCMQFWPDNTALSLTMLGLAYAFLIVGIVVDIKKVRKIRKNYTEEKLNMSSKKARAEEKARKAEQKQREEEAIAEEAKRAAEKEAKKGSLKTRFGFGKKDAGETASAETAKSSDSVKAQAEADAVEADGEAEAVAEAACDAKTESAEEAGK